jgi:L-fuculose-phosphate aldolase
MNKPQGELLFWTKYLSERGLISGSEGNLSIRFKDGFFVTPSGRVKETLSLRDLSYITFQGRCLSGCPSSEWGLHCKIYLKNPQAKAIVHTHPLYVLALERLGFNFKEFHHFEAKIILRELAFLPPFPAGSPKLWEFASNLCRGNRIVILSQHGLLAWGETLEEAVNYTLILEKLCHLEYLIRTGQ